MRWRGRKARRIGRFAWPFPLAYAYVLAWMSISPLSLEAQAKPSEYEVKAAYLYNFGKFVEWPAKIEEGDKTFVICLLGQDPFGPALDATIAGETVRNKMVVAKRVSRVQEATACQILFVSSSEESRLKQILTALDRMSVLTVSDMAQFTDRGGMIQFVTQESHVHFEINLPAAERAGLAVSSELLKVATGVRRNPQSGD